MTTSKIEEVARAIDRECRLMGDPIGPGAATYAARAAIEAMRQPTNAMANAGTRCLAVDWELCCNGNVAPEMWSRMLNAALAEGGEG